MMVLIAILEEPLRMLRAAQWAGGTFIGAVGEMTSEVEQRLVRGFVLLLLAGVVVTLIVGGFLYQQATVEAYLRAQQAIDPTPDMVASADGIVSANRMAFAVTLAKAQDFAMAKGAALVLSFLVVVLGAVVVAQGVEATYKLRMQNAQAKSALETTSPGLVMITLGLALALAVVLTKSSVDLEFEPAHQRPHNRAILPSDPPSKRSLDDFSEPPA